MLGKLFLLFTIVPIIELYLLITVGGMIGAEATLAVVFATGLAGAFLAKKEGLRVLREWQSSVARGELPKEGVASSLLVLVGGVLLVTPGVITDVVGISLLIPPTRRFVAKYLHAYAQKKLTEHATESITAGAKRAAGDFIDLDDDEVREQD